MSNDSARDALWVQGPAELLSHALGLVSAGHSDRNARIAYLLVDNCVEQAVRTYLLLPPRVSGHRSSRRRVSEAGSNFPALLDALEEVAPEVCEDLDLGSIHWLHQLRNELYRQGTGMTIRRENLEAYLVHAALVLERLSSVQVPLSRLAEAKVTERGRILANRLASALRYAASDHVLIAPRRLSDAIRILRDVLSNEAVRLIRSLLRVRHKLLHAEGRTEDLVCETDLRRIEELVVEFEGIGGLDAGHELSHGV